MTKLRLMLATAALCGGLWSVSASAMPIANLAQDVANNVENVRWVCGPFRCWWRPGPRWGYGPGWGYGRWGYGPRLGYPRYGYGY